MRTIIGSWSRLLIAIAATSVFLLAAVPVFAQEFTQGYSADDSLRRGMLVGLVESSPGSVESVSQSNAAGLHGVVVDANDAPLVLTSTESDVYVSTRGNYEILVSDANGPIKTGDYIAASVLPGVGQKAAEYQTIVLGRALQDFVPESGSTVLSTSGDGQGGQVNLGRILGDVSVGQNPNLRAPEQQAPDFLERAAELVADKPVDTVRIYISLTILVLVAAISGSLIYASVRSSITAIGRNPLSRSSILRSLIQVVLIAFLVLLSGLFAVYLILRF